MKDILGQEIKVNDYICYTIGNKAILKIAKVIDVFTKIPKYGSSYPAIRVVGINHWYGTLQKPSILSHSNRIVKIPDNKVPQTIKDKYI